MKQKITIVGLGPGRDEDLTIGALKAMKEGGSVILRTENHGIIPFLKEQGIRYTSLDEYYIKSENFDEAYKQMIKRIFDTLEEGDVVLGIPGHPLVGERLVLELLKELDREIYDIEIMAGVSRADAVISVVGDISIDGVNILTASDLEHSNINVRVTNVIMNIHSNLLASDVKLILMEHYPGDMNVYVCSQGDNGKMICDTVPLYQLDQLKKYDYSVCLYVPSVKLELLENFDFNHLVEIMDLLRSPGGCPWDREQTHESLKQYLIEETYEVLEAIDEQNPHMLVEELGDLMLQAVFHARIAKEHCEFNIRDVISGVSRKMIERHTHIFGDAKAETADDVVNNWESVKKKEKGLTSYTQVLKTIPAGLPALMRGYKVQKKAALVGFDWDRVEDAMKKVDEELNELKAVYLGEENDKISEELGDLLFAIVNVARFLKVQPEVALTNTIKKFIDRFEYVEKQSDRPLEKMTLKEMDDLWNRAKVALNRDLDV